MKYSMMTMIFGSLIHMSKPGILQLEMCRAMGMDKADPTIDEVIAFQNSKGIPAKNGDMDFEQFVKFAHDAGYDAIDLMSFHFEESGEKAKEILDRYNMKISGCCIIAPFGSADTQEKFDKLYSESCEVMDRLAKAGCVNVLLMPTTYFFAPGIQPEQGYQNMVKGIKACKEYGEKLGLIFNLETLESAGVPLGSKDQMARFFADIPDLKFAHDTGNCLVANMDPADMYETFKDRTATVHFKDFQYADHRTPSETPDGKFLTGTLLGSGLVDFKKQMQLLKRDNYSGYIQLEGVTMRCGDPMTEAKESLKYFKELEASC